VLSSIATSLNAQAAIIAMLFGDQVASEKFNISMEIGGNFSRFTNVSDVDQFKLDLNFGIAGNLMLSEHWFLSPGAYFLSRRRFGYHKYFPNTGNPVLDAEFANSDAEFFMDFIDVPIMVYYQPSAEKWRFGLGPQVSFLKNSKITVEGDEGDFVQDYSDNINNTDFGILSSVGYSIGEARKGKGLYLQVRYYQGFSDLLLEVPDSNLSSYFSIHVSLPFITDELAEKNLKKKD
jgi:hypothetical protein